MRWYIFSWVKISDFIPRVFCVVFPFPFTSKFKMHDKCVNQTILRHLMFTECIGIFVLSLLAHESSNVNLHMVRNKSGLFFFKFTQVGFVSSDGVYLCVFCLCLFLFCFSGFLFDFLLGGGEGTELERVCKANHANRLHSVWGLKEFCSVAYVFLYSKQRLPLFKTSRLCKHLVTRTSWPVLTSPSFHASSQS